MITVLVADDQALIRQAVSDTLALEDDIKVIGQAANGADAVAEAHRLHPDIVLMDIRMPVLDGIAATAEICADTTLTTSRVLILTTFEEDEYLVAAIRAGASGFIGKGAEPEEIARAVRTVHAGDALLSPTATHILINRFLSAVPAESAATADYLDRLTEREREVLILVARGLSTQEIAAKLVISPYTAKTHINWVMAKLGARDRAQLVIVAYESKLLTPRR